MSHITVTSTLTFSVDATAWLRHRGLDPEDPDALQRDFLTYIRSQTIGGLAGHIAQRMDEVTAVHGQIALSSTNLADGQ